MHFLYKSLVHPQNMTFSVYISEPAHANMQHVYGKYSKHTQIPFFSSSKSSKRAYVIRKQVEVYPFLSRDGEEKIKFSLLVIMERQDKEQ